MAYSRLSSAASDHDEWECLRLDELQLELDERKLAGEKLRMLFNERMKSVRRRKNKLDERKVNRLKLDGIYIDLAAIKRKCKSPKPVKQVIPSADYERRLLLSKIQLIQQTHDERKAELQAVKKRLSNMKTISEKETQQSVDNGEEDIDSDDSDDADGGACAPRPMKYADWYTGIREMTTVEHKDVKSMLNNNDGARKLSEILSQCRLRKHELKLGVTNPDNVDGDTSPDLGTDGGMQFIETKEDKLTRAGVKISAVQSFNENATKQKHKHIGDLKQWSKSSFSTSKTKLTSESSGKEKPHIWQVATAAKANEDSRGHHSKIHRKKHRIAKR